MSLFMIPANLLVAASIHVAFTAPTPTTPTNKRLRSDYSPLLFVCIHTLVYASWVHAAIEIAIIITSKVATWAPNAVITQFAQNVATFLLHPNGHIYAPPVRVIAGIAVVSGGIMRYLCYRELGKHFTYHVTILKDHSLVTTGPYSIIRHPAYTAGSLTFLGLAYWHAASGAWIRESEVFKIPAAWLVLSPAILSVYLTLVMYKQRPVAEDAILRKVFGMQWDEWARRVPYRLFPGVY